MEYEAWEEHGTPNGSSDGKVACPIFLSLWHAIVGINRMVRLLKQVVSEAAGEKTPEL